MFAQCGSLIGVNSAEGKLEINKMIMTDNNKFVPQAPKTYEVRYVDLTVKESKITKLAGYLGVKTVENCSSCPEGSPGRNKTFRIKVALEGRIFGARSAGAGFRRE